MEWIQVYVKSLGSVTADSFVLLLKESHGERQIPISIGQSEAFAIQQAVTVTSINPPLIHDVIRNILEINETRIIKTQITHFREGIFYAQLVSKKDDNTLLFPIRVGDAITLALRGRYPLFIDAVLLEKYGTAPQPSSQKKKTKENEPKNELRTYLDRELEALMGKAIEEENYEFAAKIQKELDRRKKI